MARKPYRVEWNGQLYFWNIDEGESSKTIDAFRDANGGRKAFDRRSAKNTRKHFSHVAYTPDGSCVLAGGRTKWVCLYLVSHGILLKKYQLSHNKALGGVLDTFDTRLASELGGAFEEMDVEESAGDALPGATRGKDAGKRSVQRELRTKCIGFNPTAESWAAATTEGLMMYTLENNLLFDPVEVDENTTVQSTLSEKDLGKALLMAIHLGEDYVIRRVLHSIPLHDIHLVAQGVPVSYAHRLMVLLSEEIAQSKHLEYHLVWAFALLSSHHNHFQERASFFQPAFRAVQKALLAHNRQLAPLADSNMYAMKYVLR